MSDMFRLDGKTIAVIGAGGVATRLRAPLFVQRPHLGHGVHTGGHTLVAMAASQLGQTQTIGLDQAHTGFVGFFQKLTHARVMALGIEMDLADGGGGGLESHRDGVKAEQHGGR